MAMDLSMRRMMEGNGRFESEDASGRRYSLDRSKLRVLVCDKDPNSSREVHRLLYHCSYKVTTVRTARQAIDRLTTQGAEIDIVLAEVDLPVAKGLKMLKCIAREKELRRIPIIMMSSQDEVSVIVKCLRLGAADYLVKPLRTNELLNLWTHTWRRRRMLGLAEKDNFNQEIEFILSDHSDVNTNSTTLLSEDTDDKTRTTHQEITFVDKGEHEFGTSQVEPHLNILTEKEDNALQNADHAVFSGWRLSCLRKTKLKVGESSAFFTYVKSSVPMSNSHFSHIEQDAGQFELLNGDENIVIEDKTTEGSSSRDVQESCSLGNSIPISENVCNSSSLQAPMEFSMASHTSSAEQSLSRPEGQQIDVPGRQPIFHLPIYVHGQPSSMQGFQGTLYDVQRQSPASLMQQYNLPPQSHHAHMMQHYGYHHVGISLPSGHTPQWPSSADPRVPQLKSGRTERRAAALMKFKQKKKERCYDKKIRYVNRKRLAEKRPRVRGQFARRANDIDQPNGYTMMKDYDSDEEEDEPREVELASSPEHC